MIDAKADWLYGLPQWVRSLMQRQRNVCTASRNSPVQFAKRKRSEEMIHVRAEVEKNINSAVERTHKNQITGRYVLRDTYRFVFLDISVYI